MASDELSNVQVQQRHDKGLNHPQLVFPSSFCSPPPSTQSGASIVDPIPQTATSTACEITSGSVDHHNRNYFLHHPTPVDFRRSLFSDAPSGSARDCHDWKTSDGASIGGDVSEGEDIAEEEGADHDEEFEGQGLVPGANNAKNNDRNNWVNSTCDNDGLNGVQITDIVLKDGNVASQIANEKSNDEMRNHAITTSACGFSGRKDHVRSIDSGEKLRTILSDPLTGALMDDAMILPCGHSFGSGGIHHVLKMKACYTCSHAVSDNSVSPNLSLRDAVKAFRREEELLANCASKKRREQYEQDKGAFGESVLSGQSRGRGLKFPFAVTDRVIIKGNKRTPPRFVGQEAIVTTQCLNGWYVVKTLDNAESVKVQYRSLAKAPESPPPMPVSTLRDAVKAFRREEELLANCASKKRRERYEQDKGAFGESVLSGQSRGRGLQFPFAVTDRVIIKGNKRTPPRFVGREAIVTTQRLNGWYVVKTLDNAESVKLQYRSLAKVPENPSPMPVSTLPDAVKEFCPEEELLANCASNKMRERYEYDKGALVESVLSGQSRGRGLEFSFAVTDRVIIKGNKRTPPRFVGREAIVTTQCLNGWYVVKTLDNAESVKLQYRSLAKVPVNPSPMPVSNPRDAVKAFRPEEELLANCASKKRRERCEQDKGVFVESVFSGQSRGRGLEFPFAVTDRVIIKRGIQSSSPTCDKCIEDKIKYVVKTLDNAESVKLQYRSLAKVPEIPSPMPVSSKMPTDWL